MCYNSSMAEVTPTKFSHVLALISYLQDHPRYKILAAKFPSILDSCLLSVDCIRQVLISVGGEEARQDGGFKFLNRGVGMHQAKSWLHKSLQLDKMKGNLQ